MESNLTHLRFLKIGDGQHTTHALGRNLTGTIRNLQIVVVPT